MSLVAGSRQRAELAAAAAAGMPPLRSSTMLSWNAPDGGNWDVELRKLETNSSESRQIDLGIDAVETFGSSEQHLDFAFVDFGNDKATRCCQIESNSELDDRYNSQKA